MDLDKTNSLRSAANSKTKIALDFLRIDKARFNNDRTPVPLPIAVIERQRKRMVNKRYMACMMARKQASRENEAKERDNREAVIDDLKRNPSKSLIDNAETPLLPWPGFRYHNNGDIRTLNNIQKQRRLLASMKAGQGHRQSTVEMPFLSPAETNDAKARASTMFKSRSVDSLRLLIAKRSVGRFSYDSLPSEFHTSGLSNTGSREFKSNDALISPATVTPKHSIRDTYEISLGSDSRFKSATNFDRKLSNLNNRFNVSSAPSNRSIGSSRLNLNQFGPAVKPLVTSSVWCNADEELMERASLIPKDSFNIRFGVSSKMLHQRKSDLDEYRNLEEKRTLENVKNIKTYIENVKKQTPI